LHRFRVTARYFKNQTVFGEIEECSNLREAEWQVGRSEELYDKVLKVQAETLGR